MNWEIRIDMYTLICIKWMTNKNLLYKKINKIKSKNSKKKINLRSWCSWQYDPISLQVSRARGRPPRLPAEGLEEAALQKSGNKIIHEFEICRWILFGTKRDGLPWQVYLTNSRRPALYLRDKTETSGGSKALVSTKPLPQSNPSLHETHPWNRATRSSVSHSAHHSSAAPNDGVVPTQLPAV